MKEKRLFSTAIATGLLFITLSGQASIDNPKPDLVEQNYTSSEDESNIEKAKKDHIGGNRYLLFNNSRSQGKGTVVWNSVWFVANQLQYGITDNISVGAGLIPGILGLLVDFNPLWVNTSYSKPIIDDKLWVSASVFLLTYIGRGDQTGLIKVSGTYGSQMNNITFGIGYGFIEKKWANKPAITFAASVTPFGRVQIVAENLYIPSLTDDYLLSSLGIKVGIGKLIVDAGLLFPLFGKQDNLFFTPILGFTVPFGNNNPRVIYY